ncbi:MAG: ABC transporter permease [Pseudomonadota bacterium]|nr:ABC transporter permease [Pseudomonadota bacterium]
MTVSVYFHDLRRALRYRELIWYRASSEIKARYKRTLIGPFWTSLSMAIFIISFGIIGAKLWNTDVASFMPYFCSGYLTWMLVSTIITESRMIFLSNREILNSTAIPIHVFVLELVLRNFIVFAHHLVVYAGVLLFFAYPCNWNLLLMLPGLLIISLASICFVSLWGIACTRYHDLGQLSNNLLQIIFFLTPIMWPPKNLAGDKAHLLVDLNPMYHFVNIIRAPMLGETPSAYSYAFTLSICAILLLLSMRVFQRFKHRIVFWV